MTADSLHSGHRAHLSGPIETVQDGHRADFCDANAELTSLNQSLSHAKSPAEEDPRILIITDDDRLANAVIPVVRQAGLLAERASSMTEGSEIAGSGGFQVVVTTPQLKDGSWKQLIGIARHHRSDFEVILLTNPCDPLQRTEAIEEGAFEVLDAFSDLPRVPETARRAFWIEYLTGACPKNGKHRLSGKEAMKPSIASLVLSGIFSFAVFGYAAAQNHLATCVEDWNACDVSSLSAAQRQEINQLQRKENLWGCLTDSAPCNHQMLNASESKEAAETHRQHNLLECLQGLADCEHSSLAPAEAAEVDQINHQRNLVACETGSDSCNHAWLSPSEAAEVISLEHQRNLLNCETGNAYCDPLKLTASEFEQISDMKDRRNVLACEIGDDSCNPFLLRPGEMAQVAEAKQQRNLLLCEVGSESCDQSLTPQNVKEMNKRSGL